MIIHRKKKVNQRKTKRHERIVRAAVDEIKRLENITQEDLDEMTEEYIDEDDNFF